MSTIINVEIAKNPNSTLKSKEIESLVDSILVNLSTHGIEKFDISEQKYSKIHPHVNGIRFYTEGDDAQHFSALNRSNSNVDVEITNFDIHSNGSRDLVKAPILNYYVFDLNEDGEDEEYMDSDGEGGDDSPASHHWILPSKVFDGLWDSLFFDSGIKTRLMEYVRSALLFSEKGVNSSLITWNKVILLHGPPGSGKTSLCKALAQKASIRLGRRYKYTQFVEINSHSLFSKWFSESGKLVMKMFEKIHQLVQDPQALVFLLIDEVESLAKCRMSAEAGNEPADSIRAVNALLTQLDRIKRYPNVMVLTTSNIVGSIDLAFVDRADLKVFIGPPPPEVIYQIYASSVNELIRVGIISSPMLLPAKTSPQSTDNNERKLLQIAIQSKNMSGRTLRKIPFLTHANYIRLESCDLDTFLTAMDQALQIELQETRAVEKEKKK